MVSMKKAGTANSRFYGDWSKTAKDLWRLVSINDLLGRVGTIMMKKSPRTTLFTAAITSSGYVSSYLGLPGFSGLEAVAVPALVFGAMLGGGARAVMDVPPFMTVVTRNACSGVNVVGMRRAGFSSQEIAELRRAYKLLYRSGLPVAKAIDRIGDEVETEAGRRLLAFLRAPSRRGLGVGPRHAYRHSLAAHSA